MAATLITLRYASRCATCGRGLAKGERAEWDRERRVARCERCIAAGLAVPEIDRGEAGGSARREWQRRHDRREEHVRQQWGRLSGLVLAVTDDPHSTKAWAYGARGETELGAALDALRDEGMAVLHDRRVPGTRANMDHLVICAAGVFVVDAKNYRGRPEIRDRGSWLSHDYRFVVGGRDKTSLVRGMAKQVDAVRAALAADLGDVPVIPAMCFVDSDWGLFPQPLRFGDVHIVWPRALGKLVRAGGPVALEQIAEIERQLALALPPA